MKAKDKAQTVLITGAYGGMGYDMARGFLRRGDNVVLTGRNGEKLLAAARRLDQVSRIAVVTGDIREKFTGQRAVETAVERFGSLHVLVNNAGMFHTKSFLETTEDELELFFRTNLKGTYLASQAAANRMIEQGEGGSIINIGTVLVDHAITNFPASAAVASKGGIHALTVSLAAELAPHNIRVNTVAPGVIRTPLHGSANVDEYAGIHPLGRVGEVAETTEAVLYLASATYTTGVVLAVDGGYRAGRR